jgi:serpin B
MKKIYYYAMAVGLLVMPLIGCSNDNHEGDIVVDMLPKTRSVDLTQEQKEYVKRSNEFALNLYKAVIQGQNDNKSTIVSPISAVYMLGMLNDGSAGKTAEEISTVLGFGKDGKQAINEFCKAMIEQTPEADPSVWLQTANCVVVNDKQHVELQDQFVNDISKYYRGEVMTLNFASAKSLDRINNWSNQYTDGMIPTVLNQLNEDAAMLLLNAISFKATWTEKFDEKDTQIETFTKEDGTTESVKMMHRHAIARVGEGSDFYTLLLPYGSGDKWSMTIFLPKEGKTVSDVVNSLDMSKWSTYAYEYPSTRNVDIKLPRFENTYKADIKNALQKMGVLSMFDADKADLSLICKNKRLCVSKMEQTTAIEVSEEGTKTSAVTVAELGDTDYMDSGDKVFFYANQPFVYIIREASSGAVFFIGTYQGN